MKVVRESWYCILKIVSTSFPDVHMIKVLDCVPVLLQVHGVTVALTMKRIGIMIIEG
jgi:hypothetical protein